MYRVSVLYLIFLVNIDDTSQFSVCMYFNLEKNKNHFSNCYAYEALLLLFLRPVCVLYHIILDDKAHLLQGFLHSFKLHADSCLFLEVVQNLHHGNFFSLTFNYYIIITDKSNFRRCNVFPFSHNLFLGFILTDFIR